MRALYAERQARSLRGGAARTWAGCSRSRPRGRHAPPGLAARGADDRDSARAALAHEVDAPPLSGFRARPARRGERGGLILGYAAYVPREIDDACLRLAAALRGLAFSSEESGKRGGQALTSIHFMS